MTNDSALSVARAAWRTPRARGARPALDPSEPPTTDADAPQCAPLKFVPATVAAASWLTATLARFEAEMPAIVWRSDPRIRDWCGLSPRTLANLDCTGLGPDERVTHAGRVGYSREAFIRWLRARLVAAPNKAHRDAPATTQPPVVPVTGASCRPRHGSTGGEEA